MENKRFCDLVVGDKLCFKINDEIETEIIRDFLKDDEYLHFRLESVFLTIKNLESDFETINENEFVSTSMDKLLLECEN